MSTVHGRGRLTDDDRIRIDELAEQGMTAGAIAAQIKRHPSTVQWYMYSSGLKAPAPTPDAPKSYMRNGKLVHRFTGTEDALIQALRLQGFGLELIAEQCCKRFGTARTAHTIKCRLIMLAAREDVANG
jgi:hypothetical protein